MKSYELTKIAAPLALIAALGMSGCTGSSENIKKPSTPTVAKGCDNPQPLEKVRIIGRDKEGGMNLINTGPCVAVYDRETQQTLGTIATEQGFTVVCYDSKPNSFDVVAADNMHGAVNYDDNFRATRVTDSRGSTPLIPACE